MTRSQQANDIHKSGFNCAQAVLAACGDLTGLSEKEALGIASCFGGGMRCGSVCGALTGALMALGLLYPHNEAADKEAKADISRRTVAMIDAFRARWGNINCHDLLEMPVSEAKNCGRCAARCPGYIDTGCHLVEQAAAAQ